MLDYLKVKNFAVVEKIELRFSPHLNVLTGETGAGKSILIGAINHFLNKKINEHAIRNDGSDLVVEAMFTDANDDEWVLRREINKKKSYCYINNNIVPFVQLKDLAERLLNIYGQNEHIFLLNPGNHRFFLDEFCRNGELLDRLADSYAKLKTLIGELDELKHKQEKAGENIGFIDYQIAEIDHLKMEADDDISLEQRLLILTSAEEIMARASRIIGDFHQNDRSVYSVMAENLKHLDFLKEIYPELETLAAEVAQFYNLLPELSSTLSDIIGKVDFSSDELNEIQDKLLRLNRLKSRYKMGLNQLLHRRDELVSERRLLMDMDFSLSHKEKEIDQEFQHYCELNRQLRTRRTEKAVELSRIIEKELAKLEMGKARFHIQFDAGEPTVHTISDKGMDRIEFYFTTNPGQPLGKIREIASGGELSRLMLVLKSILRDDTDSTYIFDEIDTGIGGKTAEFVGEKLKRIADNNQVICISHLPQIASFADSHFLVTKEFKKDQTFSHVKPLTEEERIKEIGRLMVGSDINDDVLKAAQNLLTKNCK
ncbi:MAG: DNA repair protein RecN [Candidatus Omnitrophota bacterium]